MSMLEGVGIGMLYSQAKNAQSDALRKSYEISRLKDRIEELERKNNYLKNEGDKSFESAKLHAKRGMVSNVLLNGLLQSLKILPDEYIEKFRKEALEYSSKRFIELQEVPEFKRSLFDGNSTNLIDVYEEHVHNGLKIR